MGRKKATPKKKQAKAARRPLGAPKAGAPSSPLPVVGLGASAGGLEALEHFIAAVPANCGLAFVAVTHQHPGHVSMLPELLQKNTRLKVIAAADGMAVQPNCFYLSPSEGYMAIFHGKLHIVEPDEAGSLHLPIDYFFRSLAEDRREKAVGIVLSGTGTDGTLGLKAIKGAAGMTMAQKPDSAKYSGMPQSAVNAGSVDFVLPAEEMPRKILTYVHGPFLATSEEAPRDEAELPEAMQKINLLLRTRTGNDFSAYKPTTIRRRIERRINIHQFKGPQEYLHYLRSNPSELDLVFRELLIGVTNFFRDPEAFDVLGKTVLPGLIAGRTENSTLRVWIPGCATGEEAYSLAILFQECLERARKRLTVQIFGTDLDDQAIDAARLGYYPEGIARDVPAQRLSRYFIKENHGYRIKKEIRETVVFATQNVLKDPPFTRLDMISCRNLLIYIKPEAQRRLLELFHYALKPGGVLFLGSSESVNNFGDHFAMANKKWKVFTRKGTALPRTLPPDFAAHASKPEAGSTEAPAPAPPGRKAQLASEIEKMLLESFVPTSVIVTERGDIAYIHGRTGDYLEAASGQQPRLNILDMAREGLRIQLASALRRAASQKGEVVCEGVRVKTNGSFRSVRLAVTKVTEPESIRGMLLVTFATGKKLPPPPKSTGRGHKLPPEFVTALERELQYTKETLQSTVEQLESSNEELKSTNEEMQSTNEELQSVNEELETSKEEMQSLNEELQTVNAQLQAKVDDLGQANDDMQNLLNSTEIATIFLDREFRIKRFTAEATKLINLIPSDVGRPMADLASSLDYDQIEADATEVMRKLGTKEREVRTKKGEWRQVRISPYRTTENVIDGLVLTFVDINRLKNAEAAIRGARTYAESIVATIREPLVVLDADLRIVSANRAFAKAFGIGSRKFEGEIIYELNDGQWNIPRLRKLLEEILPKNTTLEDFEVTHTFPSLGLKTFLINARRLEREAGSAGMILLAFEDRSMPPTSGYVRPSSKKKTSGGGKLPA